MTDAALCPQCQSSLEVCSRPSVSDIYEAEVSYVWKLMRRLGVPSSDLEDAVHDAFVVVHKKLDTYDPARPLRPWLAGIAVRTASDNRRRAYRRRETLQEDDQSFREPSEDGEDTMERREDRALLRRALDALREERREVVVLHDIEGFSIPEVAEMLEVPVNTLYSRLRLGRRDLADVVVQLGHGVETT